MSEEHVDYMIMANQLRSFNIHTTPLMIASEVRHFQTWPRLSNTVLLYVSAIDLLTQPIDKKLSCTEPLYRSFPFFFFPIFIYLEFSFFIFSRLYLLFIPFSLILADLFYIDFF